MNNRPLISFVISCYNQEAFIREAVEGALAQTYSPLEIIITDDHSSDRTFDIARRLTAGYAGPHTVRLNRNAANLGIGGNVNRAMELCRGELVVLADGDDVSLPGRTEAMYRAWVQFGKKPTSLCCAYTTIAADGTEQGIAGVRGDPADPEMYRFLRGDLFEFLTTRRPTICGCAHAWSPKLFQFFGPLTANLEDLVLSFRSLAIGQMLYIHQPLVKYRRHGSNVSFFAAERDSLTFAQRERRLRWVDEETAKAYENMIADIEILYARGAVPAAQRDRLQKEARRMLTLYAMERNMMDGNILKRLGTLAGAAARGDYLCAARFTPRLLPQGIYRNLYLLRNRLRGMRRSNGAGHTAKATAAGFLANQAGDVIQP